jgi:hypothetical protein
MGLCFHYHVERRRAGSTIISVVGEDMSAALRSRRSVAAARDYL